MSSLTGALRGTRSRLGVIVLTATLSAAPFTILSFPQVAWAEPANIDDLALVDKYVDATQVQQQALRGMEMEMEVEAKLPRLAKQGKLRVLRNISHLGKITYKALGFSGDNTVKQEVIARYLAAESEGRDSGAIAITPVNYKFHYQRRFVKDGRMVDVFELNPRKKRVGLFKGEIWIDGATGMPVREAGYFVKSPSVFLKKIAFVRDYELQNGISIPKHIASTVDTRLVGRAELEIAFSHFQKPDDPAAAPISPESNPAPGAAPPVSPQAAPDSAPPPAPAGPVSVNLPSTVPPAASVASNPLATDSKGDLIQFDSASISGH